MELPILLVSGILLVSCCTIQSQPTVLAPIVSTPVDCVNSWLKFRTKDPNGKIFEDRNCRWVDKNKTRCNYDNVGTHCPLTCGTCQTCTDSKADFYFEDEYNTCKIASEELCRTKLISNTCRSTCSTCVVKSSYSPSAASPSTINNCVNSWHKFKTKDLTGMVLENKNCHWVSKRKTRCNYDNVRTHCPDTCGTCETCTDSKVEFLFNQTYNTCEIASETLCHKLSTTCRATCGTCVTPSVPPSEPRPSLPTTSPPITSPPTTSPPITSPPMTSPPTHSPAQPPSDTDVPTTSLSTTFPPTFACINSEFKFLVTLDNRTVKRSCRKQFCDQLDVPTHCPKKCDACTICADSAVNIYDGSVHSTCATLIDKYTCDNENVANTCRATCARCIL